MFGVGGDGRGRKMPVGTQRYWEGSQMWVIKTHDNSPFDEYHSAWELLPKLPRAWENALSELQRIGRYISLQKEPIDGPLWLDHEFEEFTTSTGKKFKGVDFKAFSLDGRSYDFRQTFVSQLNSDKIELSNKILRRLEEENDTKKGKEGKRAITGNILTKEEIKKIIEEEKNNHKYDWGNSKPELEDVQSILDKVKVIESYLKKGEDFEGEQGNTYQKAKDLLALISNTSDYIPLSILRDDMRQTTQEMNESFKDAWGVKETFRKRLSEAFSKYVVRFKKEIEDEEFENFKRRTGVSPYVDIKTFYGKLRETLVKDEDPIASIRSYIGKKDIPHPAITHYTCELLSVSTENPSNGLRAGEGNVFVEVEYEHKLHGLVKWTYEVDALSYSHRLQGTDIGSGLSTILKLRFEELYKKRVDGEFNTQDLGWLEGLERLSSKLPKGHVINNSELTAFRKASIFGDNSDNSYAHFSSSNKEIYFSDKATSFAQQKFDLNSLEDGSEFISVATHEIGHAVSKKLGRRGSLDYRRFVKECGWSWEQFNWSDEKTGKNRNNNYLNTGTDSDIKREGSKSNVPLITNYAGKSPEEAFAEYYSFYTTYKNRIDHYLETGNSSILEKETLSTLRDTEKKYGEHLSGLFNTPETNNTIRTELLDHSRNLDEHIKVDVIDPYYDNLEYKRERHVDKEDIVRNKKDYSPNKKTPIPVFTVFNRKTGKHDIVGEDFPNGEGVHFANKYLRRGTPTFSISKECYGLLLKRGYTHRQIAGFVMSQVYDRPIPQVKYTPDGPSYYTGLRYRGDVIPVEKLVKMKSIFTEMKNIWSSEELSKSLQELGFIMDTEKTVDESTLLQKGVSWVKNLLIKSGIKKTEFGDFIIRNQKGQFLLLQRTTHRENQLMGGKWCLPGGHIDAGEGAKEGAVRELLEETGLTPSDESISHVITIHKPDCIIHYYEATVDTINPIILDNNEHYRYEWVDYDKLDDYEMVFDLNERIKELPLSIQPLNIVDLSDIDYNDLFKQRLGLINKRFDKGEIDLVEFHNQLADVRDQKVKVAFEIIERAFNNGQVSDEVYYQAYLINR